MPDLHPLFVTLSTLLLVATGPVPAEQRGIDVSHHSGEIDWATVRGQGVSFVYLKASEGVDAADPKFEEHLVRLRELDIPRGAYHFFVTEDDPAEQARFFLSRYRHQAGDLAPVVDVEIIGHGTTGDLAEKLRHFLEIVEQAVAVPPVIYTSPNFWKAHFDDSFGRHPLWIAEYGVEQPTVPDGWTEWALWQDRENATLPGVEKEVDFSRLHPDLEIGHLEIAPPEHPETEDR